LSIIIIIILIDYIVEIVPIQPLAVIQNKSFVNSHRLIHDIQTSVALPTSTYCTILQIFVYFI